MKKSDLVLIGGLIVVVILGCFLMKGDKVSGGTYQLSYSEYLEKIEDDEKFVLIIERATCSHCVTYMPIVKSFARSNSLKVYYVDTDTFTSEDWETFEESNSYLKEKSSSEDGWGTPTTLIMDGEEVVHYIEGSTTSEVLNETYDEYSEYFEKVEE